MIKYPKLKRESTWAHSLGAHSLGAQPIMVGKFWKQELKNADHISSACPCLFSWVPFLLSLA